MNPAPPPQISRRSALGGLAAAAAGVLTARSSAGAAERDDISPAERVRDRLWLFAVCEHGVDDWLERGDIRGGSRMTPAEGAFWLDVPNLCLVREYDLPRLPQLEKWRAKTSYEQYAISFQPLKRVIWSVVGSGGKGGMSELPPVVDVAKAFPNISGIYLDDVILRDRGPGGEREVRLAVQPDDLRRAREQFRALGRKMDIWATLYTRSVNPARTPGAHANAPLVKSLVESVDVTALWTWNSEELQFLEENLAALEKIVPQGGRIALGCYIWDFFNNRPVSQQNMELQCEQGLKWLKEGRIAEMIFLSNNVLDVGLPSAEFARQWIAKNGRQALTMGGRRG